MADGVTWRYGAPVITDVTLHEVLSWDYLGHPVEYGESVPCRDIGNEQWQATRNLKPETSYVIRTRDAGHTQWSSTIGDGPPTGP